MSPAFESIQSAFRENPKEFEMFVIGIMASTRSSSTEPRVAKALPPPVSTLGQVISIYRRSSTLQPASINNNISSLLRIIERVHGKKRTEEIPLDLIDQHLAVRYQEILTEEYTRGLRDPERRERLQLALRTSKSQIKQARCLFSAKDIDLTARYASDGIALPDSVRAFLTCKLRGRMRTEYKRVSDEAIQRAFNLIELKRELDPKLYLAFWLAAGAALRRSEILKCDWSMFEIDGERLTISGLMGKNGRKTPIPVQPRAAKALLSLKKDSGRLVDSHFDRRLNFWLRSVGFTESRLAMHELRAWLGSKVFEIDQLAAQQLLRHASIVTTQQNYGRYVTRKQCPEVLV